MPIRITCPACDANNTVDEEKRGRKVRCRKCDKLIPVPDENEAKKKRQEEASIQEGNKVKVKTASARNKQNDDDDDDDDDRPLKKKKAKQASKGFPLVLILAGGGALVLFLLVGLGGLLALFMFRTGPAAADRQIQLAEAELKVAVPNNPPVNPVINPNPNPNQNPIPNQNPNPNPNPNQNPIPNQNPNPPVVIPPVVRPVDPNAGKVLPGQIPEDVMRRVKQATAYLKVTMQNGQTAEGSGFLAVEPGLVITNAHVLGMLQAKSATPKQVDVTLNSGEPNATTVTGQVLGVDRSSDLAVVRIGGNLPPPLLLETERKLIETQKVFIFGFPFGAQLGKNITVSESSITSLRKDANGALKEIQVGGGMHPGNSGGPVVNTFGNIIGVSVSVIRGTQINFAVPADKVRLIMEGRLADAKLGEPFLQGGQARLPVQFACLDPLNRVRQMRVEVWTGPPGKGLPDSLQAPPQRPGDSPRQTHALNYQNGTGRLDVPLPQLPPGQVYWLQPVITTALGTQWGTTVATSTSFAPLERQPANLVTNVANVKDRTVKLKSSDSLTLTVGNDKKFFSETVEADMREAIGPDPKGFQIRTGYGSNLSIVRGLDDKQSQASKLILDGMRTLSPIFTVDATNKILGHKGANKLPLMQADIRDDIMDNYARVCNSLEALTIPMPNRMVQPMENWQVMVPLPMRTSTPAGTGIKKKGPGIGPPSKIGTPVMRWEFFDLALNCTYEGTRTRDQRREALISIAGKVQGRNANAGKTRGDASGKIAYDLEGNFISFAQLKILQELEAPGGEATLALSFDVDLTRVPGNALNIQLPAEPAPKVNDPTPKPPFPNPNLGLRLNTPNVIVSPTLRNRTFTVILDANKNYTLTLVNVGFNGQFRIEDSKGKVLGENGANMNPRVINIRTTQAGIHRVQVMSADGRGSYQLTVRESP